MRSSCGRSGKSRSKQRKRSKLFELAIVIDSSSGCNGNNTFPGIGADVERIQLARPEAGFVFERCAAHSKQHPVCTIGASDTATVLCPRSMATNTCPTDESTSIPVGCKTPEGTSPQDAGSRFDGRTGGCLHTFHVLQQKGQASSYACVQPLWYSVLRHVLGKGNSSLQSRADVEPRRYCCLSRQLRALHAYHVQHRA